VFSSIEEDSSQVRSEESRLWILQLQNNDKEIRLVKEDFMFDLMLQ
jgi:hypothetical protein